MVLEPKVLDYIKDDTVMFEREPMEQLAREGQLMCFASITDFGSVWTHCVTRSVLKSFGTTVLLLGKCGRNDA